MKFLNWREDILNAQDELDYDEFLDICNTMAARIIEEDDSYDCEPGTDEYELALSDEMSSFINVFLVYTDSGLYEALERWYDHIGIPMEEGVRGYYEDPYSNYFCFYTGVGYDWVSKDLLHGRDGIASREFENLVEEWTEQGVFDDWIEDDEW